MIKDQIDKNDLAFALERNSKLVGWCPDVRGEKGKINPHITNFLREDGGFMTIFHVKPVYYETVSGHWRPLSEITTHHGNTNIVLNSLATYRAHPRFLRWLSLRCELRGGKLTYPHVLSSYLNQLPMAMAGLTTLTAYPDPNVETTTFDGTVKYDNVTTSWATTQTGDPGTQSADSSAQLNAGLSGTACVTRRGNGRYGIERSITGFDTSSIGSDTIDDATVSLYCLNVGAVATDFGPCSATPASNTAIALADQDQVGDSVASPTHWATWTATGSLSTSAYNDWLLNATGEAGINKSGVTNIGWRVSTDVTADPGFSNGDIATANNTAADTSGTTQDPKLVVNHSAAAATVSTRRRHYWF